MEWVLKVRDNGIIVRSPQEVQKGSKWGFQKVGDRSDHTMFNDPCFMGLRILFRIFQ